MKLARRQREGERYRLHAEGSWRDLFISCGPDGYDVPWYSLPQLLAGNLRRVPAVRWFALVGVVRGAERHPFLISSRAEIDMPATGILSCYAIDVPRFYWNNSGALLLTAERLA